MTEAQVMPECIADEKVLLAGACGQGKGLCKQCCNPTLLRHCLRVWLSKWNQDQLGSECCLLGPCQVGM